MPAGRLLQAGDPADAFGVSKEQELLIRAALLSGPPALQAWRAWSESCDLETLQRGTYSLLPGLYRNLENLRVESAFVPILKGVYKRTWVANKIVCQVLLDLVKSLHQKGIQVIPLGGAASLITLYRELGLRPVSELTLAVRPEQAEKAGAVIRAGGYRPCNENPVDINSAPSGFFDIQSGLRLELRWSLLPHMALDPTPQPFWGDTVTVNYRGENISVLNPSDALFYSLARDSQWDASEPLAWLGDAFHLLNKADIDWDRLIYRARCFRSCTAIKTALAYLQYLIPGCMPGNIMRDINGLPSPFLDRLSFQAYWASPEIGRNRPRYWNILLHKYRLHKRRPPWFILLSAIRHYMPLR